VLNELQISSEEILTEFFLIIQNQKNTLYQNVAGMLNIHHVPNHLSRAAYSALDRARKDSLEALIPVESIKKPLSKPKVSLKIKMPLTTPLLPFRKMLPPRRGDADHGVAFGEPPSL
jgi:hypothetical protein